MSGSDQKATLHRYLKVAREAVVWKLEGLSEYDVRLIDGAVGLRAENTNVPEHDEGWWADHRERLERAARQAAGMGD